MEAEEQVVAAGAALTLAVGFPAGTDVLALARAWFPDAEPGEAVATPARRLVGARFGARGAAIESARPGLLRLTAGASLRGPSPRTPLTGALPVGLEDVYVLEGADSGGPLVTWMVAAARRSGGAIVDGSGRVLVPPPDELVDLTVYAPAPVPGRLALAEARSVAPMMRPEGSLDGEDYRLVLETPYDGTVTLTHARRAELPVVLTSLEEGATGPFATVLTWIAPDAAARDARSVVGRIARERVMPVLHRLALTLRARSGGAVVDAGGFLVTPRELESRASR